MRKAKRTRGGIIKQKERNLIQESTFQQTGVREKENKENEME